MNKPSPFDTPHERFVGQFDRDGNGYLYRPHGTGPLYRLTEEDRDALVATFDRRQRRTHWTIAAIFIPWIVALLLVPVFRDSTDWVLWISGTNLVVLPGVQHLANYLVVRSTVRALASRTPIAPALSKAERQRLMLEQLPLTLVVGIATATSLLLLFFALERPQIGVMSVTLLVASVAALAWAIMQGARKWMLARADHVASNLT